MHGKSFPSYICILSAPSGDSSGGACRFCRSAPGAENIPQEATKGGEMSGAAGGKRPAPVEPHYGGGAAKRQQPGEGGAAEKEKTQEGGIDEKHMSLQDATQSGVRSAFTRFRREAPSTRATPWQLDASLGCGPQNEIVDTDLQGRTPDKSATKKEPPKCPHQRIKSQCTECKGWQMYVSSSNNSKQF